jgi:hypothetical protein
VTEDIRSPRLQAALRTIKKIRAQTHLIYAMAEPGDTDTRIPALAEAAENYRVATLALARAFQVIAIDRDGRLRAPG